VRWVSSPTRPLFGFFFVARCACTLEAAPAGVADTINPAARLNVSTTMPTASEGKDSLPSRWLGRGFEAGAIVAPVGQLFQLSDGGGDAARRRGSADAGLAFLGGDPIGPALGFLDEVQRTWDA
jgi:hypothetical protein